MKKIVFSLKLALAFSLITVTGVFAQFTNGDFETGDFTGWTKSAFTNRDFGQPPGAGGGDLSIIVGSSTALPFSLSDPNTGDNLMFPASGNYSARINSELSYGDGGFPRNANMISQMVPAVLDPADNRVHLHFNYSAVMVRPVHNPHEEDHLPYFRVWAINVSNGNDILFDFASFVGEPGRNWQDGVAFGTRGDYWQYLDWTSVDLVSSPDHPINAGDTIILKIVAAGCSLGGHPGYVYIDGINDGGNGGAAGLSIQAEGPATATAGSTITYTYTYENDLANPVDPTIVINPPTHVTFTTLGDAVNCSGSSPVTCNFTGVPAGGSGSFTVTGNIDPAAEGTTLVHDGYTISATGIPPVSGSPVLTDVVDDSAILSLTASGPASVKPGDQYVYTMNYTNDEAVSNAQVSLTLPGHTTLISADVSCTAANGTVTCDLGDLNAGSGSFDITVQVDKLKKVGIPLILDTTSYSISATNLTSFDGSSIVSADVLTPFADVPLGYWGLDYIQSLWAAGVTTGCGQSPLRYCPDTYATRADSATFIERALGNVSPSPNPSGMFADVPYPGLEAFTPFIEQFYNDGITRGCAANPLRYCPQDFTTRGEAAVFIERALGNFAPAPNPSGMFADVPYPGLEAFTPFIEQLYNDGITSGCAVNPLRYCPQDYISRAAIAVFVQRAFNLPLPS